MDFKQLVQHIVEDTKVDLTQEFDRNFERKAFFNKKWKGTKHANSRGSLLNRSGKLRRSINKPNANETTINWRSNLAYASMQNEGGELVVTKKMKSFFWAMYYKSAGAVTKGKTERNRKLTGEAAKWKAMALMPVGHKMEIEQRQFIGWHPEVDIRIKKIVDYNLIELNKSIAKKLKP